MKLRAALHQAGAAALSQLIDANLPARSSGKSLALAATKRVTVRCGPGTC